MNETSVFCILGIAALGFVIFTDVETMEIRRDIGPFPLAVLYSVSQEFCVDNCSCG